MRIHYTIVDGGEVPNVIPEYAKVWTWVRDSKRTGVKEVMSRVQKMVAGAALMADVEAKLTVQGGDYEMLVNMTGAKLLHANLTWLGPIEYTAEEQEFARSLQRSTGKEAKGMDGSIQPLEEKLSDPPGGSTDVADVSWIVPTLDLSVATAPVDTPWHSWAVVASSGATIGHKGMIYAAKALAATMVDLFEVPIVREAIRAEFLGKTKGHVYEWYIPEGPPPLPNR